MPENHLCLLLLLFLALRRCPARDLGHTGIAACYETMLERLNCSFLNSVGLFPQVTVKYAAQACNKGVFILKPFQGHWLTSAQPPEPEISGSSGELEGPAAGALLPQLPELKNI